MGSVYLLLAASTAYDGDSVKFKASQSDDSKWRLKATIQSDDSKWQLKAVVRPQNGSKCCSYQLKNSILTR